MNITPKEAYIPLTPTAFHVLLALAEKPMYGYGIVQQCQFDSGSELQFERSPIYRSIQRLCQLGLVQLAFEDISQGSPYYRRYYQLSKAGRTVLEWECDRYQAAAHLGHLRLAKTLKHETMPL